MFATLDPVIGVVLVAAITPLATLLLASHKLSGRIRSSEAESLWAESSAIRDWSAQRIQALERRLEIAERRADECEARQLAAEARASSSEAQVELMAQENGRLITEVRGLRVTIAELHLALKRFPGDDTETS